MHGSIFAELNKYVEARLGGEAWPKLLQEAGLPGRTYEPLQTYPDEDAGALVAAASRITGLEAGAILEDFGVFIAPDLLEMYWGAIRPEWKTLDVIENAERAVHEVVRLKSPGATPPILRAERAGPDEVRITYSSARRMCKLAEGIGKGLARQFQERLAVDQTSCMLNGDPHCVIRFRRLPLT